MPVVMAVILAATLGPAAAALERRGVESDDGRHGRDRGDGRRDHRVVIVTLAALVGPMAELVSTATAGAESSGAQAVGIGSFVGGHRRRAAVDRHGRRGELSSAIVMVLLLGGVPDVLFHPRRRARLA